MIGELEGVADDEIAIGMPLRVAFDRDRRRPDPAGLALAVEEGQ